MVVLLRDILRKAKTESGKDLRKSAESLGHDGKQEFSSASGKSKLEIKRKNRKLSLSFMSRYRDPD